MLRLDMPALRHRAMTTWLTANPANLANAYGGMANSTGLAANDGPEISQSPHELAALATLAISQQEAERLTARLLAAAVRCCDFHGDDDAASEEMRVAVLATPHALRADLLRHLNSTYPETPR